jgi:hypothetical protein
VCFDRGNVLFFMAIEAKLTRWFGQQSFYRRLVWRVTGSAFSVSRGIMFECCFRDILLQVLMALIAEFAIGLDRQVLVVGNVRTVTGGTLQVFHRLMFDFRRRQLPLRILMAIEA